MATRETVRMMTDGQRGDIIATMATAIPALTFDEAQNGIIGNKGPFVADIRKVFEKYRSKSRGPAFTVTLEGRKASELVRRGQYDWTNDLVTDERFPIEKHAPIACTIEFVEFDHDPTSEEVLEEFERRGLERPTAEDALVFGATHPEEQRKRPIVFLHEPLQALGHRLVLVLYGHAGGRYLSLLWFDLRWDRCCVFAAVRK